MQEDNETEDETEPDWENFESGPFCEHWGDPCDCEELCECGHKCCQHDYDEECSEDGCDCKCFQDEDLTGT